MFNSFTEAKSFIEEKNIKMGPIATPLRVLVCNADKTPQIDRTLALFGKKEVTLRSNNNM